jgi:hypothetical protein
LGLEEEVENSQSKNWFQPLGEKLRIKEPLLVLGISKPSKNCWEYLERAVP